ncbi:MAG: hypothetical protein ACHP7N_04800 [Caulobacterales bacterium]
MADRRTLTITSLYVVACAPIGAWVIIALLWLSRQPNNLWVLCSSAALCLGWAVYFMVLAWLQTDEAARTAHKFAWFWGGSCAAAIALFAVLILFASHIHTTFPGYLGRRDPAAYIALGALGVGGFQALGYALVWSSWWLRTSRNVHG